MERDAASLPELPDTLHGQHTESHGVISKALKSEQYSPDSEDHPTRVPSPPEATHPSANIGLGSKSTGAVKARTAQTIPCEAGGDKEASIESRKYHPKHPWECTICNKTMQTGDRVTHIRGKKHKLCVERTEKEKVSSTPDKQEVPTSRDIPMEEEDMTGHWECTTCYKTIPMRDKKAHIRTRRHKLYVYLTAKAIAQSAPVEQGVPTNPATPDIPKDHWQCVFCNRAIPIRERETHIRGRKHQQRINGLSRKGIPSTPAKQKVPTSPATSSDEDDEEDEDEDEDEDMDMDIDTGSGIPSFLRPLPSDRGMMYQCDICDGEIFLEEHLEHHSTAPWKCKACKKKMHLGSRDAHLATAKHRNRARKLEKTSKADKSGPKGRSNGVVSEPRKKRERPYCEPCGKYYGEKRREFHIGEPWECTICNLKMHMPRQKIHLGGRPHAKMVAQMKSTMKEGAKK